MARLTGRRIWLNVHLYIALVLGAFVAMLGLTGSILVFQTEADGALLARKAGESSSSALISADQAVRQVEGQLGLPVALVRMPSKSRFFYRLELHDPVIDDYRIVIVDARTGAVIGNDVWGRTFFTFVSDLHTNLFLGGPGLTFVGWLGFVLIVSIVTGLYLWWPRLGQLKQAFKFRPSRRLLPFSFELHRLTGAYLAVVLFVVALAGSAIALPEPITAIVRLFGHVSEEPEGVQSAPNTAGASRLPLAEIQHIVGARAPGGRLAAIRMPRDPADSFAVRFVDQGEPDSHYGRSTLWIDQYSGRVLHALAYSELGAADRFMALQLPLHDGEILGVTGRLIVLLSGIGLVLMYVTGLYLWLKRPRRSPASR